jgi:uncharacterized protein (DUF1919 family)
MLGRLWQKWKTYRAEQARNRFYERRRKKLLNRQFAIIANNCWGGEIYKYFDLPFNSPFIGLFLFPDCFLTLLENLDALDLESIKVGYQSKYYENDCAYPVGILEHGIEIHFLHYKSLEEAQSKWKRRAQRLAQIPGERRYFKFCDRDGATLEHMKRFEEIPQKAKIGYSVLPLPYRWYKSSRPDPKNPNQVDDGVKLFEYELENGFNPIDWMNLDFK